MANLQIITIAFVLHSGYHSLRAISSFHITEIVIVQNYDAMGRKAHSYYNPTIAERNPKTIFFFPFVMCNYI